MKIDPRAKRVGPMRYEEWETIMNQTSTTARVCVLAAGLVAASACGGPGPMPPRGDQPARDYDQEADLLHTSAEDEAMNAAIDRARATASQVVARLEHAPPGLTYAGVKVRLGDPDGTGEHIWLYDVKTGDGEIAGKLVDDARLFPEFRSGDVVRVEPREISDWMTVENGRACGGFTQRIMVGEMSDGERDAYFAQMGIPRLPPGDAVCDEASPKT